MLVENHQLSVVLVDDHPVVRQGTKEILEEHGDVLVVGEAGNSKDAYILIKERIPDILVLDVRLPGESGIEFAKRLSKEFPQMKLLILSAYGDSDYLRSAFAAGVSGYLLKSAPDEEIINAIYALRSGAVVVDRSLAMGLREGTDDLVAEPGPPSTLSDRELEVVRMVVEGLSNKAIADRLDISRRTVETHIRHIFDKLGVNSRTKLSVFAMEKGLVSTATTTSGANASATTATSADGKLPGNMPGYGPETMPSTS